jgi:hypothetical protein
MWLPYNSVIPLSVPPSFLEVPSIMYMLGCKGSQSPAELVYMWGTFCSGHHVVPLFSYLFLHDPFQRVWGRAEDSCCHCPGWSDLLPSWLHWLYQPPPAAHPFPCQTLGRAAPGLICRAREKELSAVAAGPGHRVLVLELCRPPDKCTSRRPRGLPTFLRSGLGLLAAGPLSPM